MKSFAISVLVALSITLPIGGCSNAPKSQPAPETITENSFVGTWVPDKQQSRVHLEALVMEFKAKGEERSERVARTMLDGLDDIPEGVQLVVHTGGRLTAKEPGEKDIGGTWKVNPHHTDVIDLSIGNDSSRDNEDTERASARMIDDRLVLSIVDSRGRTEKVVVLKRP